MGLLITTEGDVIDYDFVEEQIKKDAEKFDMREMAYDDWNATEIINHLMKDDVTIMVPMRQGTKTISEPTKAFERRVLAKEIAHGNNPIMKWMVSCTEIWQDAAGNIKPVKPHRERSGKRIDGVYASIMALDRAWRHGETGSIYEEEEMLFV